MFTKIVLPTTAVTVAALTWGLIYTERVAAFEDKPSIRLRVMTGDLPTANLQGLVQETTAAAEAAKAQRAEYLALKKQHEEIGQVQYQVFKQLEQRIQEKHASQWSDPTSFYRQTN